MDDILLTVLLALWLASAATGLFGAAFYAYQTRRFARIARGFATPEPPPPAAIIVPLKGAPAHAAACVEAMLAQDYPRYRLIVAVESESDPGHRFAKTLVAQYGARVSIVIAGRAERRGQKVHNLIAALTALGPGDATVCFADADALWSPDTLTALVRELAAWTDPLLLSGYRWMFPAKGRAGGVWAAAASLPVAAIAKAPAWDIAWGGTMALKRDTLERIDLPALWDRSLSDDVPLSAALRRAGSVKLMPNLVVPSPAYFSIREALDFARRQYAMVRLYAPRHWLLSLLVYAVFFAGAGASVAAFVAPAPSYLVALALGAWAVSFARGVVHAGLVRRLLPPRARARMGWACALDTLLPAVPALLHAYGLIASIRPRRIVWAGITYSLEGGRVVSVER